MPPGLAEGSEAQRSHGWNAGAFAPIPRISWRRRVLLLAAVMGCLAVFLLARLLAITPHIDVDWHSGTDGRLELESSPVPALRDLAGSKLLGIVDGERLIPVDVLTVTHSARWLADDALRERLTRERLDISHAMEAGTVRLAFEGDTVVEVAPGKRGYGRLGLMFWLMSALGMVLFLVGWIVPLVHPHVRNTLYAVMALAQATQLLLIAASSVPGLYMPDWLIEDEAMARTLLDVLTATVIAHASTIHPTPLPHHRWLTGLYWAVSAAFVGALLSGALTGVWWWTQLMLLGSGGVAMAMFYWSYRRLPHPLVVVSLRFGAMLCGSLALVTLAMGAVVHMAPDIQAIAAVGPVIWCVFLSSLILLIPFLARSQNVMREFALLAGVSTVATSVDLLFVAVFSLSQFASLTVSLFIALGLYAAARQFLVTRMVGARALTTERLFDHLYRIAREVEARPERATERMTELLRNVFEPLETLHADGHSTRAYVAGSGSTLLVPIPRLTDAAPSHGQLVLRFAERGKRLFTTDDARLADRVVEQLMRAVAHDRAVERGRSEERMRIAQDLHDDIGARLLTLMYKSPTQEMEDYVRHTLQDLKTLTRGLAAASHSLSDAMGEWKADIGQRLEAAKCELEWRTRFEGDVTLTVVQWSSLTRILRELVNNVITHAGASHVTIDAELVDGALTLVIADDGKGLPPEGWAPGLGLGGVRKRVKSMAGQVVWQQREPQGIVCTVRIPRLSRED